MGELKTLTPTLWTTQGLLQRQLSSIATPKTREWSVCGCVCTCFPKTKNITKIYIYDVDTWKSCIWTGGWNEVWSVWSWQFFFLLYFCSNEEGLDKIRTLTSAMPVQCCLKFEVCHPWNWIFLGLPRYFLGVGGSQVAFRKMARSVPFFRTSCLCRKLHRNYGLSLSDFNNFFTHFELFFFFS